MGGLDCRIGKSYREQIGGYLLRETGVGGLLRFCDPADPARPTVSAGTAGTIINAAHRG